jgi:4-hydroxythreonine-4-phosphate dehydrogenase
MLPATLTGWIGIALGDVTGIGPEVTLRALAHELDTDTHRYLLIGDEGHARRMNERLELRLSLPTFRNYDQSGRVFLHCPSPEPLPATLAPGSAASARAALAWLSDGAQRCLRREIDALVTAPLNKEAVIRAGEKSFTGQTEFLAALAGTERVAMMLLGEDDRHRWLRVTLATTHVPLKRVADELSQAKIERAIELAAQACRSLGLPRARVGVCGLNPHAGEGGELGTEEQTLITPAVLWAQNSGLDVIGPLAADTVFYQAYRGDYDAVVAMYHDQGLCPLKMVAFENGVNWTLGLPFIRTSPDHGTAYDIAGQGKASPSSMRAALRLAKQLACAKVPNLS